MGDSVVKASFSPLIQVLSHLVRSLRTTTVDDSTEMRTATLYEDPKDMTAPKHSMIQKVTISEEQILFVTNENLIDLVMRHGYEVELFADMISHLCTNNKHLSKQICALALRETNKTDFERVCNYLQLMESMLKLEDFDIKKGGKPLQSTRLEWILGFPFLNKGMQEGSKHVIGLESLYHDIAGEIYTFKSTLTQENSLLQLLYRYQVRHEDQALQWLGYLADIVTASESLMEFFSTLPSITYQHARYSDWIEPFLQSQLNKQVSSASYNYGYGGYGTLSKDDIIKIISKFEVYDAYIKKKDGSAENSIEEEKENAGKKILTMTPTPFIICRALDENYLPVIENGDVFLNISTLKSSYVKSKPTGYTNDAISAAFLQKGAPKATLTMINTSGTGAAGNGAATSSVGHNKSAAQMLREHQQQTGQGGTGYGNSAPLRVKTNNNANPEYNRIEPAKPDIQI